MKKSKKALLVLACAGCLVVGSVFGTLAYLTDNDKATNTFTVGKVDIELDEKNVDKTKYTDSDGNESTPDRDKANEYHILPGHSYEKDPTVTIKKDSEESYVRMLMTVYNAHAVQGIINADDIDDNLGEIEDYADLFSGWSENTWKYAGFEADTVADTITFEFRYYKTVNALDDKDVVLEPLFKEIVVPGYVTNDQLAALYGDATNAEGDFKMEIVAHAIQASGFEEDAENNLTAEDVAWQAFDGQINKNN